jgi:hypothetical protein
VTRSRVDLSVIAGTAYLVRVAGWGGARGDITLNIANSASGPFCGDAVCNGDEDPCSCPADSCEATCGDLCCSFGEDPTSCPSDCATLVDVAEFQNCFSGVQIVLNRCDGLDFDHDLSVDLVDYSEFFSRRWPKP